VSRRRKHQHSLARKGPKREPYDRALIVCEGSKTEPYYLRELIAHYQLSSANVEIHGEGDSSPSSVVSYAIELFEADPDYDVIFCVFDRDQHADFGRAVQRVRERALEKHPRNKKAAEERRADRARFDAITSIPCFEYWVLLHFEYTTAAMPQYSDVRRRLRAFSGLRHYEKADRGVFAKTRDELESALKRADRANRAARQADTDNPTTNMPVLIRYLQQLASTKIR
jgi:hypothetical protein